MFRAAPSCFLRETRYPSWESYPLTASTPSSRVPPCRAVGPFGPGLIDRGAGGVANQKKPKKKPENHAYGHSYIHIPQISVKIYRTDQPEGKRPVGSSLGFIIPCHAKQSSASSPTSSKISYYHTFPWLISMITSQITKSERLFPFVSCVGSPSRYMYVFMTIVNSYIIIYQMKALRPTKGYKNL